MKSDFYRENEFIIRIATNFSKEYLIYREDTALRAAKYLSNELNKVQISLEENMDLLPINEESEIVMLFFKIKQIARKLEKEIELDLAKKETIQPTDHDMTSPNISLTDSDDDDDESSKSTSFENSYEKFMMKKNKFNSRDQST